MSIAGERGTAFPFLARPTFELWVPLIEADFERALRPVENRVQCFHQFGSLSRNDDETTLHEAVPQRGCSKEVDPPANRKRRHFTPASRGGQAQTPLPSNSPADLITMPWKTAIPFSTARSLWTGSRWGNWWRRRVTTVQRETKARQHASHAPPLTHRCPTE